MVFPKPLRQPTGRAARGGDQHHERCWLVRDQAGTLTAQAAVRHTERSLEYLRAR